MPERIYDVHEMAKLLKLPTATLRAYRHRGLPRKHAGMPPPLRDANGAPIYDADKVDEWLKEKNR